MITVDDINKNRPVIVKWDKKLINNGVVTEGVIAGQAEEFISRIEEQSELLSNLRYIEMLGETQDIQGLRVRANLQNLNKISGDNAGAQVDSLEDLTETIPDVLKQTLEAQPFTAFTYIPKTFLKTNVEKDGFISKYEALLVPSVAYSAEQIALFGKATFADTQGIHALKGILAQLDDVKSAWTSGHSTNPKLPMGKYITIDASAPDSKSIIPQIDAMLEQFTFQRGKRKEANIYVSSKLESKLIAEASKRETEGGDRLFFNDNGNLVLRGREVIQLDALDNPANDYEDVVLIMNPDSVGYGPVMEAESEATYEHSRKSYLTSVDVMFDVGIIFPEDVLYADVNYTPSD